MLKQKFLKISLIKMFMFLFLSINLLLNLTACNKTEPPIVPPEDKVTNTITLAVEWTDLYRINVKWNRAKADTTAEAFTYLLTQTDEQGNKITKQFTITGTDTSCIAGEPDSLQQGKNYKFYVEAYNKENKLKDTSKTITGKTLSPTSHNITWQIDTLGQAGNFLYDVWGLDENNVWAVGYVDLPEGSSGIIKWNGSQWLPFTASGGVKYGIFGFNENSLFVVGESINTGFAAIWNGSSWTEFRDDYFLSRGDTVYPLRSVWGSSSNDVWAVGDRGTIIHWDGNQWSKDEIIAEHYKGYRFTDIWGFAEDEIYATGRIYQDSVVLLKYDGENWKEILKKSSLVVYSSVWGPFNNFVYLIEYNNYSLINGIQHQFSLPNRTATIERIRGSNSNNIFVVGHFGEVFHFNGTDWKKCNELNSPFLESSALRSCFVTEHEVIIVGLTPIGAIVIKGTIQ